MEEKNEQGFVIFCQGFEEELQLLDDLESQCARHPEALKILLESCWMPPFHRILKTPKSIPETLRVLKVIRLGQMMLTSKAVCSSTISFLAIAYKESLLPLLAKGMHKSRAGLAADPPHPLEAELPSPEQLDSTILRAIVSILSSAKKHKETHLLGQITTILTECVSFVAKGLAIKMDDDPGFLPTNIFTPYKATEIAKDGCNQKISSPAQQPKSCSSFSSVDLRIEVHGMTIEFEDLERLTSVVTRSQQSSPNSCHQSSPPKIGLQDLVDGHGDQSDLHIIIFDEIDAICKTRGSTRDGTGMHDSIVNQLLTKIDGVEALNNILLIGMTNKKDLLDEALLRPGRMEVQIEIGLPDEKGWFQILSIHSKMKENSFLSADVDLKELASKTKNFSGAELEGLVKSATSFALNRQVSAADLSREIVEDNIKVTMDDFMSALNEVKPAFGAAINTLEMCRLNGMLDCGERHAHIQRTVMTFVEQVSFKVREHLCSLASLKDLVAVVRQHWQQLLELKVVFHSLKLLCFQCSVQSSTMLSMHFNGHFREHRRV
ncbi:unnamed protein product [Sphagnum troendelagicum]